MRRMMITVTSTFVVALVACTIDPPPPEEMPQGGEQIPPGPLGEEPKDEPKSGEPGKNGADTCPYTGTPLDTTPFAKCLGEGRCVPEDVVPKEQRARLAICETTEGGDGLCVPEKVVANKGLYVPKACTSIAGGEGRCTSRVFPDMEKQKDTLPKDVCEESERCAPCFDPMTGADTGACRSVECDAPKKPKVVLGECCKSAGKVRGRCLPVTMIPEANRSNLDVKECAGGEVERCVPAETLSPTYVPPKCTGRVFLKSYTGVCISNCVRKDFLTDIGTSQGDCSEDSFCAPCANPLTGEPTGAPGCS